MALVTIHDESTGYVVEIDAYEGNVHLSFFDDPRADIRSSVDGIALSPKVIDVLAGTLQTLASVERFALG